LTKAGTGTLDLKADNSAFTAHYMNSNGGGFAGSGQLSRNARIGVTAGFGAVTGSTSAVGGAVGLGTTVR